MVSLILYKAPRAHLFTRLRPLRPFASIHRLSADSQSSPFGAYGSPAPPRLPKEEQELFESLQRDSTGAFSTPRSPPRINQSPGASPGETAKAEREVSQGADKISNNNSSTFKDDFKKAIEARGKGEELHPNVRRGAAPEFEGDRNPKTGETGGPKNEPLRWGPSGEWSYNGRTTDF
jgi:hypothetical protein